MKNICTLMIKNVEPNIRFFTIAHFFIWQNVFIEHLSQNDKVKREEGGQSKKRGVIKVLMGKVCMIETVMGSFGLPEIANLCMVVIATVDQGRFIDVCTPTNCQR